MKIFDLSWKCHRNSLRGELFIEIIVVICEKNNFIKLVEANKSDLSEAWNGSFLVTDRLFF